MLKYGVQRPERFWNSDAGNEDSNVKIEGTSVAMLATDQAIIGSASTTPASQSQSTASQSSETQPVKPRSRSRKKYPEEKVESGMIIEDGIIRKLSVDELSKQR